ncbi:MAG: hypothetical protein AAGL99_06040 [Pseudomonadota bacterium]
MRSTALALPAIAMSSCSTTPTDSAGPAISDQRLEQVYADLVEGGADLGDKVCVMAAARALAEEFDEEDRANLEQVNAHRTSDARTGAAIAMRRLGPQIEQLLAQNHIYSASTACKKAAEQYVGS